MEENRFGTLLEASEETVYLPNDTTLNRIQDGLQREGFIFASPTDTVYGLQCAWDNPSARLRLSQLKSREEEGKFIVLIPSLAIANRICALSREHRLVLERYWPGPFTFILPLQQKRGESLSLALRMPKSPSWIAQLLAFTGQPLASTSCNPARLPPAANAQEARRYFGNTINLYVDEESHGKSGGTKAAIPSALIDLMSATPRVLRQGPLPFS